MQTTQAGTSMRLSISGADWPLGEGEAFFGPAQFELRAVKGDASDMALTRTPCGRGCRVLGTRAGAVAVVMARQVTTKGRLLTHAWSVAVAASIAEGGEVAQDMSTDGGTAHCGPTSGKSAYCAPTSGATG